MGDSETQYVIDLQTALSAKFAELGIVAQPETTELVHHLAEVAAKSRTLEREILPLLLSVNSERNEVIRGIMLGIKAHLDSIQDSITDLQPALRSLLEQFYR